jgi:hypothetical protein
MFVFTYTRVRSKFNCASLLAEADWRQLLLRLLNNMSMAAIRDDRKYAI